MRENRTHGSEGGDGESRSRPLSDPGGLFVLNLAQVLSKEHTKGTKI